MSIVTVPTGSFTPGAQATLEYSAAVINASWDLALTKSSQMQTSIATATTGFLDIVTAPHITGGTASSASVVEPTITISDASTTGVYDDFQTQYLELVALLSDKYVAFQTTYFPDEHTLYAQAESWLQAALADPSGLPATVRAQLLADDAAVIIAETSRAKDSVIQAFAARRFPVPSGQALSATLQLDQSAQDKIAASSRNITKLSIDNLHFAVEKAETLRQIALGAAGDYVKALASGPDMASRLVGIGYDAQSKMVGAASQFYNARIAAAEQVNKVSQFNVGTALEVSSKNQMSDIQLIDSKLKALLTEVTALAQQSNALFNNLHANAGTSYSVSA